MRHQALRPVALMLCVLLIAGAPAQADTIRLDDVVQTVNGGQRRQSPELRLRSVSQSSNTAAANNARTFAPSRANDPVAPSAPSGPTTTTSIISSGITTQQDGNIETIDIGDVTGTVCDCGEIPVAPGGGFPRWPLLALAGIPLFFRGGDDTPDFPRQPPPPGEPIPEPATLLLFGTSLLALGAGARRRRQHATAAKQGGESSNMGEEG